MKRRIEAIKNFSCPRWTELPNDGLLSSQVINYINGILCGLIGEKNVITKTMIQNYLKWGIIPAIEGRKYGRKELAYLIVISIYKQVIPINAIKKGVLLQQSLMKVDEAYDHFAQALEESLFKVCNSLNEPEYVSMPVIQCKKSYLGLELIAYAFAFRLFGLIILYAKGTRGIEEINE